MSAEIFVEFKEIVPIGAGWNTIKYARKVIWIYIWMKAWNRFRDILKKIEDLFIRDETRARINFEKKECSRAVQAWKAHLLRSVNQEGVKQNALTQLDEE
ncbi:unnamed protein product [Porites lobata]|uniref:Uncharacterized protein n=1 Tax=Porites lobata TaxID=104759 RepID=A0ABN8NF03_9CNID|nr:unnamed protein product [Porites lobata]